MIQQIDVKNICDENIGLVRGEEGRGLISRSHQLQINFQEPMAGPQRGQNV